MPIKEPSRTAVVIEDDDDVRDLLHTVLTGSGFLVHTAPAGLAGVEMVRRLMPDVVTLDVGLPDIDGFEVAERIRRFSTTFIVMLTARAAPSDEKRGFEAGANRYLRKPFRPAELRRHIQEGMAAAGV
ncbi:response regulator transcription factor [Arthrobacter burdickii]|jgi:DNA-binding response OmpR family regulator|uniref:Response regulator n=1 Tax=Arthrobacter burdickii TaxID=3035920 RepID=A0ABT8K424_9MICC|nr:response regulator [Arthrobacter burdickii]MDN4611743.1 response regulator [Arthrobacter burdickii]